MFTVKQLAPDAQHSEAVLQLGGEVDALAAESVLQAGVSLLDSTDSDVVVDLGAVTFIDSTGLGALVGVRNHALESGRAVRVAGAGSGVERIFRITGLDEPFNLPNSG